VSSPGTSEDSSSDASEILKRKAWSLDHLENRELGQTRILALLLERNRSVGDVVAAVYGRRSDQIGYRGLYMRVSRRLKSLESRGYVSRNRFGKERPYRITRAGKKALSDAITYKALTGTGPRTEAIWGRTRTVMIVSTGLVLFAFLASRIIIRTHHFLALTRPLRAIESERTFLPIQLNMSRKAFGPFTCALHARQPSSQIPSGAGPSVEESLREGGRAG